MFDNTEYRNHISYAVEREASRELRGDPAGDFAADEFDDEAAEIYRMVELSGMIGLECNLLQVD